MQEEGVGNVERFSGGHKPLEGKDGDDVKGGGAHRPRPGAKRGDIGMKSPMVEVGKEILGGCKCGVDVN